MDISTPNVSFYIYSKRTQGRYSWPRQTFIRPDHLRDSADAIHGVPFLLICTNLDLTYVKPELKFVNAVTAGGSVKFLPAV